MINVAKVGDSVRFAYYDIQGVRPVVGVVTSLRFSRRTGRLVSVVVDLTACGRGPGNVVPIERLEVVS